MEISMQAFLLFMDGKTAWIVDIIILAAGLLLLTSGLKIYKTVMAVVSAAFCVGIGIALHNYFGWNDYYIVALVLGGLGLFLGIKYYYVGLYLLASLSTWLAVFSYFLKQALAQLGDALDGVVEKKQLLALWLDNSMKTSEFLPKVQEFVQQDASLITAAVEAALGTVKRGILIAGVAGVVVGILAIVLGDFIIIFATSVLGSTILVGLVTMFVELSPDLHLVLMIVFTGIGIVMQSAVKKKRRKAGRN